MHKCSSVAEAFIAELSLFRILNMFNICMMGFRSNTYGKLFYSPSPCLAGPLSFATPCLQDIYGADPILRTEPLTSVWILRLCSASEIVRAFGDVRGRNPSGSEAGGEGKFIDLRHGSCVFIVSVV